MRSSSARWSRVPCAISISWSGAAPHEATSSCCVPARTPLPPATFHVCYAAQGASECLVAGHPPIPLQQDHALLLHADAGGKTPGLHVNPLAAGAIALVAVIDLA